MDIGFQALRRVREMGIMSSDAQFSEASAAAVERIRVPRSLSQPTVRGVFGDPKARVISLVRRSKKRPAAAVPACSRAGTTGVCAAFATCRVATRVSPGDRGTRVWCQRCGAVKEKDPLPGRQPVLYQPLRPLRGATLPHGDDPRRGAGRNSTGTVKSLEKQYMAEQLRKAGTPGPQAIGIDEIAIRRGHTYRIVVSDLIRGRAMWFGDRTARRRVWRNSTPGWARRRAASAWW